MATGVLLELGLAKTIEQAETMVKDIRPEISIHQEFRTDLQKIFSDR